MKSETKSDLKTQTDFKKSRERDFREIRKFK